MDKVSIANVNHPGSSMRVDASMYEDMKRAYLAVLPDSPPGLTIAEISKRLTAHLSPALCPGGAKAGWWSKAVQLDLEAKGVIRRTRTSPLSLYRA
jgi:hypothetical protein